MRAAAHHRGWGGRGCPQVPVLLCVILKCEGAASATTVTRLQRAESARWRHLVCFARMHRAAASSSPLVSLTVPPPPGPPSCPPPVEISHTGRPYIDPPTTPPLPSVTHRTPGHYAAFYGHADFLKAMLARGADPNSCNLNGCSILHFAAGEGGAGLLLLLGEGGRETGSGRERGREREREREVDEGWGSGAAFIRVHLYGCRCMCGFICVV